MLTLRSLVRRILKNYGFEPKLIARSDEAELYKIIETLNVDCVIDIGANKGDFTSGLRAKGYGGLAIGVEPIKNLCENLKALNPPIYQVVVNAAVSSFDGNSVLHVSKNTVSSSINEITNRHIRDCPESIVNESVAVTTIRGQSLIEMALNLNASNIIFIKIDVQGHEWDVLDGFGDHLNSASAIMLEMSFFELYKDQKLFSALHARLYESGFVPVKFFKGFTSDTTGVANQMDGVYVRRDLIVAFLS